MPGPSLGPGNTETRKVKTYPLSPGQEGKCQGEVEGSDELPEGPNQAHGHPGDGVLFLVWRSKKHSGRASLVKYLKTWYN